MAELNTNLDDYMTNSVDSSSSVMAISEEGMDSLAVETIQLAKTVNDYLNKLINIVDRTKGYYTGKAADSYRKSFSDFSANFSVFVQNIENYAYSIKKAKNNYVNAKDVIVRTINNDAISVADKLN